METPARFACNWGLLTKIGKCLIRGGLLPVLVAVIFTSPVTAQKKPLQDHPGFKDPGLFTRMPHYFLSYADSVKETPFDGYQFEIIQDGKRVRQRVEGHYWYYKYRFEESAGPIPSPLQIVRNYENAAIRVGGKVMGNEPKGGWTTLMIAQKDKEIWAFVQPYYGGKEYHLLMIEKQAMRQEVVADAVALQNGLVQSGHVEVPGIFFDFGKADIHSKSQPALEQVAKLLKGTPSLRVWVVGHTDYIGSPETNLNLSRARAAAVVSALSQQFGIDPKRLGSQGLGPYAPVGTNATEEGRAKNRRVELVAQP